MRNPTPRPWFIDDRLPSRILSCEDHHGRNLVIADASNLSVPSTSPEANAKHIVVCVNALEGLNPHAVRGLVAAAKLFLTAERQDSDLARQALVKALKDLGA